MQSLKAMIQSLVRLGIQFSTKEVTFAIKTKIYISLLKQITFAIHKLTVLVSLSQSRSEVIFNFLKHRKNVILSSSTGQSLHALYANINRSIRYKVIAKKMNSGMSHQPQDLIINVYSLRRRLSIKNSMARQF